LIKFLHSRPREKAHAVRRVKSIRFAGLRRIFGIGLYTFWGFFFVRLPNVALSELRARSRATTNVYFPGFVSVNDLVQYYRRAKVYAQLSHTEAFGCALVEAMACECTPVVVDRGALREVVGDAGFYAHYNDPVSIAHAIRDALDSGKRNKVRDRVKSFFSLEKRETELISALNGLFKN